MASFVPRMRRRPGCSCPRVVGLRDGEVQGSDSCDGMRRARRAEGWEVRTEAEIRARIADISSDERMSYKPANVFVNAPLALIQVEGESVRSALEWVLGQRERCAGSFRTTEPADAVKGEK